MNGKIERDISLVVCPIKNRTMIPVLNAVAVATRKLIPLDAPKLLIKKNAVNARINKLNV